MTDENLNVVEVEETKACECPVCKMLRSENTKKFLAVVLASFIGCSLAILVFAPKKHHKAPRPLPPYERFIERPMPPVPMHDFRRMEPQHPDYRTNRDHAGKEFRRHNPNLQEKREDFARKPQNCKKVKAPQKPIPVAEPQPPIE